MESIEQHKHRHMIVVLAAVAVVFTVIFKHLGFLAYLADARVLKQLSAAPILENLVVTPSIFALFALSFYAFGKLIFRFIFGAEARSGHEWAVFTALGMGAANYVFFLLGRFSLLSKSAAIVFLAAGAALCVYFLIKENEAFDHPLPGKTLGMAALTAACGGLLYNAVAALSFPVSWDALAYQLAIPKFYAAARGFVEIPGMKLMQCIAGGEYLTAAALAVSNDRIPQLFSFLSECIIIYLIVMLGKRIFTENIAWAAAALFALTPAVLKTGGIAGNDLPLAMFVFLAAVYFWKYVTNGNIGRLYLSAIFCGFAASMKMTGLVTAAFLIGALAAYTAAGKIKPTLAQVSTCMALFLLVTAPVFYQKYALTGNPLFPFFHQYINPSDSENVGLAARLNQEVAATEGSGRSLLDLLKLPYNLVAHQSRFQDMPQYFVIPALLVLLVRLASREKPCGKEVFFGAMVVFYFAIWFFTGRQLWRLLLGIMPFMFLLVFDWLAGIRNAPLKISCAALFLINAVPFLGTDVNNKLFAVFALPSLESPGTPSRDRYLEKSLDHYEVYEFANKNLPAGSKVLLFREIRGYYLDVPYIWGDPVNQAEIVYGEPLTPESLKAQLDAKSVTHVIVNYNIYFPSETYYSAKINHAMNGVLKRYGGMVFNANAVALYELKRKKA